MKRYVFVFIFYLLSFNLFATQNAGFPININKNVIIEVGWFAVGGRGGSYIENQNGLYWDLLIWAKNAQNQLNNKTGHIFIVIDNLENNIEISEKRGKKFVDIQKIKYKNDKKSKKLIFTALNTFFNIDVNNNAFSSIQVFLVNYEGSGLSIEKGTFCSYIFFTEEGAADYIKGLKEWKFNEKYNYFIEKIVLTKRNINNVRFIS